MNFMFNRHPEIPADAHAFLSPSQNSWINYDKDKLIESFDNHKSIEHGTKLHALAKELIDEGIKLPRTSKTLNLFVNDAIGYKMQTEVTLVYSKKCFGHADAIAFNKKSNFLRIHDLKTGVTKAHMRQLKIYAALFCLEYKYKPTDLEFELRIYQYDGFEQENPDPKEIELICDIIVNDSNTLEDYEREVYFQ